MWWLPKIQRVERAHLYHAATLLSGMAVHNCQDCLEVSELKKTTTTVKLQPPMSYIALHRHPLYFEETPSIAVRCHIPTMTLDMHVYKHEVAIQLMTVVGNPVSLPALI